MNRDEFMELVYETFETFADETDNVLANGIIEAADAYAEHEKAQLSQEGTPSDTISRQAALEKVRAMQTYKLFMGDDMILIDKAEVQTELMMLPPVQPERKHGKWLADNRPGGGFWVCSCCKFPSEAFAANVLYKFCPNCGADMRGKKDE